MATFSQQDKDNFDLLVRTYASQPPYSYAFMNALGMTDTQLQPILDALRTAHQGELIMQAQQIADEKAKFGIGSLGVSL